MGLASTAVLVLNAHRRLAIRGAIRGELLLRQIAVEHQVARGGERAGRHLHAAGGIDELLAAPHFLLGHRIPRHQAAGEALLRVGVVGEILPRAPRAGRSAASAWWPGCTPASVMGLYDIDCHAWPPAGPATEVERLAGEVGARFGHDIGPAGLEVDAGGPVHVGVGLGATAACRWPHRARRRSRSWTPASRRAAARRRWACPAASAAGRCRSPRFPRAWSGSATRSCHPWRARRRWR